MSDLNDPRVLFAAERTLLAWNRSSLTLMAFGFVIERFGLLLHTLLANGRALERGLSFWVGLAFIVLGSATALHATIQYRRVLKTLRPVEIPERYSVHSAVVVNVAVGVLGVALSVYLFIGTKT